jgi:hypothetical protein
MSADIEKLAVIDSRIVQSRPKFAVEKGALSITNAPFNAIAATSSQLTFNVYVPSENVFVDRKVLWSSTVCQKLVTTVAAGTRTLGESILVPGRDFALCALPLNSLCSTLSATINDTTSVINSQDVLKEILRLADFKKNRQVRTAATMLDKFANYNDAFGALASPLGGYDAMTDYDNQQNGAFPQLVFTNDTGNPLGTASPAFAGARYDAVNGIPVFNATGLADATFDLYIKWTSTEPICLSPFVFSDECEWDTGLFGINNIQLIMNLKSEQQAARVLRQTARAGRSFAATYSTTASVGAISSAVLNCQFLTPSLDVPLPPKSCVNYMEFPRYISAPGDAMDPGESKQISSQTITLPCIPDLLIIYAKPQAYERNDADYYFPIDIETRTPFTLNFDNFSGLLSSMTPQQLFQMSVKNGLNMDWATWSGKAHSAAGSYPAIGTYAARQQGQIVPSVGGLLVLKPGQDISLQSGQAASCVGNYTLQFNITLKNTSDVRQIPQLYVITANSGFFESIRGSSRIIKGVLSEQDVISAPLAPMGTRAELERMVGGFSFSSLGNILSKARDIYSSTKPLVSAVKNLLPESGLLGKIKSGAEAVGYGTGAGTGAGKKSLASRLM